MNIKIKLFTIFFSVLFCQNFTPANNSILNYTQVYFSWPQIPNSSYYSIQINNENDNISLNSDKNSIIINHLKWGKNYNWKVSGYNQEGIEIYTFNDNLFTINPLPIDYPSNVNILTIDSSQYLQGINILDYESIGFSVALDKNANPIWFAEKNNFEDRIWATQFLNNGNIVGFGPGSGYEFDLSSNIIFQTPSNYDIHHHFYKPNNSSYFMLDGHIQFLPCPEECPDNLPNTIPWLGDKIIELDTNGDLIWEWSTFDYFSPDEYNPIWVENYVNQWNFGGSPHFDWTHSNSVFYDNNTNRVYLSSRNINRITAIDYFTKDILWSMGDASFMDNQFFDNDFGFSGQHSAQITENGNLILFDNGRDSDPRLSRCIEINISDDENPQLIWEYTLPDTMLTLSRGECDRLINGNTLITAGRSGNVIEINNQNDIVWHLNVRQSNNFEVPIYRTERIPNLFSNVFSFEIDNLLGNPEEYFILNSSELINLNIDNNGWAKQTYDYKLLDTNNFVLFESTVDIESYSQSEIDIILPDSLESFVLQVKSISNPSSIKHIEFTVKLLGDINDDDILNILDIIELIQIILNDQSFVIQGDINFDGGNNILDIIDLIALII